jgi:hypothetical protein
MNFLHIKHAFTSLFVLSAASLALACGASPGEQVGSSEEAVFGCPAGWIKDCSNEGLGGKLICGGCYPLDGYFSITQQEQAPSVTTDDGSWLDLGPYPFPPELDGTGCTRTAIFHRTQADTRGGRVWYCPADWLTVPDQIAPLPTGGYIQSLLPGRALTSHALGSPKTGYVVLAEDILSPCGNRCIINHGCSGTCDDVTP